MAIKPKTNLADYFSQNTPANSQITPIGQMTYPPIGSAGATAPFSPTTQGDSTVTDQGFPLSAYLPTAQGDSTVSGQYGTPSVVDYFNNSYAMGFTTNAPAGASNFVGIDAGGTSMSQPLLPSNGVVNYFTNTFALGFTSNMGFQDSKYVGIAGTPGAMTYTQPPNQQISAVNYMGNTNKTGFTTGRQAMDASEFTGIAGQPGGMTYSGAPQALSQTDYFDNLYQNGFIPNKVHLDATDIAGVSGTPGAMDYTPPTPLPSNISAHGNPVNMFTDTARTGFHANEVHLGPSRYVGVMGSVGAMTYTNPIPSALGLAPGPVNYFTDVAQTGFTLNQVHGGPSNFVGVDGAVGGMTYTNPVPHPQYGSGPGEGVDYMGNEARPGFDKNFTKGTPSKYVGIDGAPGAMTYANPMPMTTPTHGLNLATNAFLNKRDTWNENNRYGSNEAATKPRFLDLDEDFSQVQSIYNGLISKHAAVTTQMLKKGIQVKDGKPVGNFNGTEYQPGMGGLQLKLPAALEYGYKRIWPLQFDFGRSNFLLNRGLMKLYSMQSQFRVGDAPFHWLRGTVLLPWIDPFAAVSALIPGIAGTVAGLPMKLKTLGPGTYARKNSIFKKFGLGVSDINFSQKTAVNASHDPRQVKPEEGEASLPQQEEMDLIPFMFHNINMNSIIQFRGTMKTINTSYSPQWSQKRYFGRPDPVWKYGGYSQTISFSFTVYALSPEELWPMYRKVEMLIGMTRPEFGATGIDFAAPIGMLTIGDYHKKQPGVLQSLSVAPDEQVPWDIGYQPGEGILGRPPQFLQFWGETDRDAVKKDGTFKFTTPSRNKVLPRVLNITCQWGCIEKQTGTMGDAIFGTTSAGYNPLTKEEKINDVIGNLEDGWNDSNKLSWLKKSILGGKDRS